MPVRAPCEQPDSRFLRTGLLRCCYVVLAVFAAGCSAHVPIETTFPAPLVETIPLSVGIHYDEDFKTYSYEEKIPEGVEWTITLGSANVNMFDRLMGAIFRDVVMVDEIPSDAPGVDVFLKPILEEYAFLTPRESGSDFYAVSIRYRIELYATDGSLLGSWPINSYGKTRTRLLKAKASLAEATVMALRDAEAALAVDFHERPQVLALLDQDQEP